MEKTWIGIVEEKNTIPESNPMYQYVFICFAY